MLSFRSVVVLTLILVIGTAVVYTTFSGGNITKPTPSNFSLPHNSGEENHPAYVEINPTEIKNTPSKNVEKDNKDAATKTTNPPQPNSQIQNPKPQTNPEQIPNPKSKIPATTYHLPSPTNVPPPPKESGSAIGYGISGTLTAPKSNIRLAVDKANKITVAWEEGSNILNNRVYVKRWDGSNWLFLGREEVGVSSTPSRSPSLAISKDNIPVVSYIEINLSGTSTIRVKKWDSTTWGLEYGMGILAPSDVEPIMVLDKSDNPYVGFISDDTIHITRWKNNAFTELPAITLEGAPSALMLAINNQNNPVIAYRENDTAICVKKWDGKKWLDIGTGVTLIVSREAPDVTYTLRSPSLCLDAGGNPIIAYYILSYFPWLYVERWNGSSWVSLMNYSLSGAEPNIALARDNNPVMTYTAETVTNVPIYVRKWDGKSTWQEVDLSATGMGVVVGDVTGTSRRPQVAIGPDGRAIAAWIQHISDAEEYIYIRRQR